ncbi:hypothetical protein L596_011912 [Steinernema carpocapsae]|uniref:Nuclear receptor domain-containing protein n=1 Tax=Steinernema carpocapsae TaxID=34508 RepID=A0A4U5NVI2_STECR|nr:hypothetical protein L596_011912 [Steinernema carpocapsae]
MQNEENCLVCGAVSTGIHFQVICCRACAVFFRRTVVNGKDYKCRRSAKNCLITQGYSLMCRFCRYQKCLKIGMRINGVKKELEVDEGIITAKDKGLVYDAKPLVEKLKAILLKPFDPIHKTHSSSIIPLLMDTHNLLTTPQNTKKLVAKNKITVSDMTDGIEEEICNSAKWVMTYPAFANLSFSDKWLIYKRFWPIGFTISVIRNTISVLGADLNDFRFIHNGKLIGEDATYELPPNSQLTEKEYNKYMRDSELRHLGKFTKTMKRARLTDFELIFVLLNSLWSVEGIEGVSAETVKLAKAIGEQLTDEIHTYYVNEMRQENYASRLAKILRLQMECEIEEVLKKDQWLVDSFFGIVKCVEIENGVLL